MRFKSIIVSSWLLFLCLRGYGQSTLDVTFQFFDDEKSSKTIHSGESFKVDSLQLQQVINQRLNNLYEMGYLAATTETRMRQLHNVEVFFFANKVFKTGTISQGNLSDEIANKVGFAPDSHRNRSFTHRRLVSVFNTILDYAENHGYPFASIRLDSISIKERILSAQLNYQSGPMIVFDSLIVSGYDKIKAQYLMTHLGIYKGKPYEEKLVKQIENKLKLLPYLKLTGAPESIISEGKCVIYVELTPVKVSSIDGILGILPGQNQDEGLLLTGQLNLDLRNLFASGKRFSLAWQSFDVNSQLLDVFYYHPNLFRTPLNVQGDLYLLKQDTTFINRELALDLSVLSKNSSQVGFRYEFLSSRLISTSYLQDITQLPENTDYNLNYYGFNYRINRFNDVNFPTLGWGMRMTGSVGQKKIIRNPQLNDDIYNDIELNTLQIKLNADLEKLWTIYKNILFRTKLSGGYLQGEHLFESDLFRVGGLASLRGFLENQFFTSGYGIANLEVKAIFTGQTYFMLFFDQAIFKNDVAGDMEYPFGTGAGFSFNTDAGRFNFVFALGKSSTQAFNINRSKIHFGYISRF